jgi:environmental stress-induced protein Ves
LRVVKKAPPAKKPAAKKPAAAARKVASIAKNAVRPNKKVVPPVRKSAAKKPPAAKSVAARRPLAAARKVPAKGKKPLAAKPVMVAKKKPPAATGKGTAAARKPPARPVAAKLARGRIAPAKPIKSAPAKPAPVKAVPGKSPMAKPTPVALKKSLPVTVKAPAPKTPPAVKANAVSQQAAKPAAAGKTAPAGKPLPVAKPALVGKIAPPVESARADKPAPAARSDEAPRQTPAPALAPIPVRLTHPVAPIMPRAPIASWIKKPAPPVKKSAAAKKPPVKLGPLVRLVPEDYQPVPVKHQRWTVRDVAVAAPGDRPLWRVSLTRILQDCDFTVFDRMDRTIMMIDGLGFELDFGGNGKALLDRRYNPIEFRGEWSTRCRLISGPAEVVNVITDRRRATHNVTVMALGMNERLRDLKGDASVVFCLVGEAELVLGKDRFLLAAGETLRSTVHGRLSCRAASASALIYVVEVKRR